MKAQPIYCTFGTVLLTLGLEVIIKNYWASAFIAMSVACFVCCICKEIYDAADKK